MDVRLIRQRGPEDCGTASVAMLACVSYVEAADAVEHVRTSEWGTTTAELADALLLLGMLPNGDRLRATRRPWHDIPRALVKVTPRPRSNLWHWVVWDGRRVFDPASRSGPPELYRYSPRAFLAVPAAS